jgi:hypothetical protein
MKAIVVPPHFDPSPLPQPSSLNPRLMVVDTNGTSVFPPLYAQPIGYNPAPPVLMAPPRNPLVDYYTLYSHQDVQTLSSYNSWYPNSVILTAYDLVNRVWELRTVIDWINAKCDDFVLIQRTNDASSWLVVFVSVDDHNAFKLWYGTQTVARFNVQVSTPAREKEYNEWMQTNIRGRIRTASSINKDGLKSLTVSVDDRNEELLFKLRWVGVPDEEEEA